MNNEDEENDEDLCGESRPYSVTESSGNLTTNIYTLQQSQNTSNSNQENVVGPSLRYVVTTSVSSDYKPCYRSLVSSNRRRRPAIDRTE